MLTSIKTSFVHDDFDYRVDLNVGTYIIFKWANDELHLNSESNRIITFACVGQTFYDFTDVVVLKSNAQNRDE